MVVVLSVRVPSLCAIVGCCTCLYSSRHLCNPLQVFSADVLEVTKQCMANGGLKEAMSLVPHVSLLSYLELVCVIINSAYCHYLRLKAKLVQSMQDLKASNSEYNAFSLYADQPQSHDHQRKPSNMVLEPLQVTTGGPGGAQDYSKYCFGAAGRWSAMCHELLVSLPPVTCPFGPPPTYTSSPASCAAGRTLL